MRMLKAFFALVGDPRQTEEVFKILDGLTLDENDPSNRLVLDRALANDEFKKMAQERFQPVYEIEDLLKLSENTLGGAYARHMKKNNLDPKFYPDFKLNRTV